MPSNSMRAVTSAVRMSASCQAQTVTASSVASCTQLPPFFQTISSPLPSAHTIRIGPASRSRPALVTRTGSAFDANANVRPHVETIPSFAVTGVHGAGTAPAAIPAAHTTANT